MHTRTQKRMHSRARERIHAHVPHTRTRALERVRRRSDARTHTQLRARGRAGGWSRRVRRSPPELCHKLSWTQFRRNRSTATIGTAATGPSRERLLLSGLSGPRLARPPFLPFPDPRLVRFQRLVCPGMGWPGDLLLLTPAPCLRLRRCLAGGLDLVSAPGPPTHRRLVLG